jgi:hypothetical protein
MASGHGAPIRFGAIILSVALAGAFASTSAAARKLDLANPDDAVRAEQKMTCSLTAGETVIYWWEGSAYSRVPGERDRYLFNVEGMNIRQCSNHEDPKRGHGFRSVSREVLFYKDPETNEILRTWKNPWTGETVEVIHVANDPVNMRAPLYARGADGAPFAFRGTFAGNRVWTTGEAPLFYKNPLAGDYQEFVGNDYHAMEALNAYTTADDLLDAAKPTLKNYTLSWARFSEWLPWMKMGGRTGMMIFSTVGGRVANFAALPASIREEIEKNYPLWKAPPPLDDARPNETTWTYVKKIVDQRRAKAGAAKAE